MFFFDFQCFFSDRVNFRGGKLRTYQCGGILGESDKTNALLIKLPSFFITFEQQ